MPVRQMVQQQLRTDFGPDWERCFKITLHAFLGSVRFKKEIYFKKIPFFKASRQLQIHVFFLFWVICRTQNRKKKNMNLKPEVCFWSSLT